MEDIKYTTFVLGWYGHSLKLIYFEVRRRRRSVVMIDDSCAWGGDQKHCSVREDNSNMCKDVIIEIELM